MAHLAPDVPTPPAPAGAPPIRQVSPGDQYLDRLRKLLPVEVSGAFIAINSSIEQTNVNNYLVIGIIALLVILCFFYLKLQQGVTHRPQLIFTSLIAFPVWATAIAYYRCDYLEEHTFVMPVLVILVSLISPLVAFIGNDDRMV